MSTDSLDPEPEQPIAAALAAVPWLLTELDVTMSRSDAVGRSRSIGLVRASRTEQALPIHTGASRVRSEIIAILAALAGGVSAVVGLPSPNRPVEQSHFVRERLLVVRDHSDLSVLTHSLTEAVQRGYRAIDCPEPRDFVGHCACGVWLYTRAGTDIVRCNSCGAIASSRQRRQQMLNQLHEFRGTAIELARLLPEFAGQTISANRIRQWARRGKLAGREDGGRTVYRLGDVLQLCIESNQGYRRSA